MTRINSTSEAKKLVLRFVMENIDYRKRSLYLQEIISMSRANDVWRKALTTFFDTPAARPTLKTFSQN